MKDTQRRKEARYPIRVAAEITFKGEMLVGATQNISSGGVAVLIERSIPQGAKVKVCLFLTQDGIEDPDEGSLEAPATVAWTKAQGKAHGIGLRLEGLDATGAGRLRRFVQALSKTP